MADIWGKVCTYDGSKRTSLNSLTDPWEGSFEESGNATSGDGYTQIWRCYDSATGASVVIEDTFVQYDFSEARLLHGVWVVVTVDEEAELTVEGIFGAHLGSAMCSVSPVYIPIDPPEVVDGYRMLFSIGNSYIKEIEPATSDPGDVWGKPSITAPEYRTTLNSLSTDTGAGATEDSGELVSSFTEGWKAFDSSLTSFAKPPVDSSVYDLTYTFSEERDLHGIYVVSGAYYGVSDINIYSLENALLGTMNLATEVELLFDPVVPSMGYRVEFASNFDIFVAELNIYTTEPGEETGSNTKVFKNDAWKSAEIKVFKNDAWKSATRKTFEDGVWKS